MKRLSVIFPFICSPAGEQMKGTKRATASAWLKPCPSENVAGYFAIASWAFFTMFSGVKPKCASTSGPGADPPK